MVDEFDEHSICNRESHVQALRQALLGWCCSGGTTLHPRHHIHELFPASASLIYWNFSVPKWGAPGAGASCSGLPTLCARLRSRASEKRVTVWRLTGAREPLAWTTVVQFKLTLVHVACSHFFRLRFDSSVCHNVVVRNGLWPKPVSFEFLASTVAL